MARIWNVFSVAALPRKPEASARERRAKPSLTQRATIRVVPVAVLVLANVQTALADAQSTGSGSWPNMPPFQRGTGNYLRTTKIVLCWLVFLAWVRTTDMLSQDCLPHAAELRALELGAVLHVRRGVLAGGG